MPVDCTIAKYTDENGLEKIKATMEQYFYGDFNRSATPTKKSLIKSIGFSLQILKNKIKQRAKIAVLSRKVKNTGVSTKCNRIWDTPFRFSLLFQRR